MSGLTYTHDSIEGGALRRWDLRGPNGLVRFETADALGFKTASVYLHAVVAPAGAELEDCTVCGRCWHDALAGSLASDLREDWETFSRNDNVILTQLQRWYNEELSTPVPVSGESQVAGEVGPGGNGPNFAATGAGEVGGAFGVPVPVAARVSATAIRGALYDSLSPNFEIDSDGYDDAAVAVAKLIEPVPVAAQPRYILDKDAILELVQRYGEACKAVTKTYFGDVTDHRAAKANAADLLDAIRAALTPVPVVEPEPAWGSGPLVKPIPETPAGAKPREPVAVFGLSAAGTGEADPVPTTLGTGSADPDGGRR